MPWLLARTVHFTHRADGSVIRHGLTDRQVGHLLDVQVQPREWNGMPLFFVLQAALPSCSSVLVCLTGWQVPFGESRTRRHTGSGGADRKVASEAEWLRSIRPLIPCPAESVSNCSTAISNSCWVTRRRGVRVLACPIAVLNLRQRQPVCRLWPWYLHDSLRAHQ